MLSSPAAEFTPLTPTVAPTLAVNVSATSTSENITVPLSVNVIIVIVGSFGATSAKSSTSPIVSPAVPAVLVMTGASFVPVIVTTTVWDAETDSSSGALALVKLPPSSAVIVYVTVKVSPAARKSTSVSARLKSQSITLLLDVVLSALNPVSTARAAASEAGGAVEITLPDESVQTVEVRTSVTLCVSEASSSESANVPLSIKVAASPSVSMLSSPAAVSPPEITGRSFVPSIVTTMFCVVVAGGMASSLTVTA